MRKCGLQGVVHGKAVHTTKADKAEPCPLDRVIEILRADFNMAWLRRQLTRERPHTLG